MKRNIVLIGMPGSGKTTIGKELSLRLERQFIDIDDFIEKKEKMTVNELFKIGEYYFRELESKAVEYVSSIDECIISTGGGVVKNPENVYTLKKSGILLFIDRPVNKIVDDINTDVRPLLKGDPQRLYQIYDERYNLYLKYCDIKIDNNKSIEGAVSLIIKSLNKY